MIYEELLLHLQGSVISFGTHSSGESKRTRSKRPWDFLLTCSLVHAEASKAFAWPSRVLFDFSSTSQLITCLSNATPDQLRSIRSIRVNAAPTSVYPSVAAESAPAGMPDFRHVAPRFPGLRLDVLEIHPDRERPYDTYAELDRLIKHGRGWKELRYELPATCFIWCHSMQGETAKGQKIPVLWDRAMKNRDSGGGVTLWEGEVKDGKSNVMVVVRRGDEVDYAEDGAILEDPTLFNEEIKSLLDFW